MSPNHDYEASTTTHSASFDEDNKKLEALGYVPSFKREFSNLATVCLDYRIRDLSLTDFSGWR